MNHVLKLLRSEVDRRLGRPPASDEEFSTVVKAIGQEDPTLVSEALAAVRGARVTPMVGVPGNRALSRPAGGIRHF